MNKVKRILLVEDDPLIVRIYKTRLEKEGFEVDSVSSGGRVLDRLLEKEFDLILLDLVLPEESGFEVLREVRNNKKVEGVKVVVLSNLGEKEHIEKAMNMGAFDYLVKAHFTPTEIIERIEETLK